MPGDAVGSRCCRERQLCLDGSGNRGRGHGDAELLTQLFVNLVENALRHTPVGTRIVIALDVDADAATAKVCDDGPGIAAEDHEKVFRRFYRVASSRSTPGNGLGLSLVAAIAKLHQARIELSDNAPGLCVSIATAVIPRHSRAGGDTGLSDQPRTHELPGFSPARE